MHKLDVGRGGLGPFRGMMAPTMGSVSIQQIAQRAGVDEGYIRRLEELGALRPGDEGYEERDVHVVALLRMWEEAGLSADSILAAVNAGQLSLDFLDAPAWELPEPLPITYREFAEEQKIPLHLLQGIQESMGFASPDPDDLVARDDAVLAELVRIVLDIGGSDDGVRRLFRLYADNLRRLAAAEADLYIEQLEKPWVGSGTDESELMRLGAEVGRRMAEPVAASIRAIYERHRQHVWTQYAIQRAEVVLERAGLLERTASPPAICFVDMTGYTRLTEEQGDEVSARLATTLAALVDAISRRHGGRAIRWLGDGGMFLFEHASAAFLAALEMSERAPAEGLPPTHIGIQAGPVIFRDGDVYGRTVNIASRIADRAEAGEVLTSRETVEHVGDGEVDFLRVGPVELQGLATPLELYRVVRRGSSDLDT
jgi:class 3 adenylate cyclase/DNA-binding transcriptional MerR regulator